MEMAEIEQRIQDEFNTYYEQVYPNPLPTFFIDLFKRCVMALPPKTLKLKFTEIEAIVKKDIAKLTNMDIGKMANILMETPLREWDADFKKALVKYKEIQFTMLDWNMATKKKQAELNVSKENLVNLSGLNINKKKLYTA